MPQISDITIKAADDTTDVVFKALSPSSGDKTPAVFRVENISLVPGMRPNFRISSKDNGSRTARRVHMELKVPYSINDSGQQKLVGVCHFSGDVLLPQDIPQTHIDEVAAYIGNLLDSTLIKDSIKSGYSPH